VANGIFVVDTPDLVRRSDIVLGRANTAIGTWERFDLITN